MESVAQEVASFGIGMTIVEPGVRAPSSATAARRWQISRPSTTKPQHIASCGCSIPKMAWPPVTGPNGRAHHRERRCEARAAANSARFTGAGGHSHYFAQADRRFRSADRSRRFHGLPARRVTNITRCKLDGAPGLRLRCLLCVRCSK